MKLAPLSPSRVGILLLDSQLRLVHFNGESASILGYPKQLERVSSLDAVESAIHGLLQTPPVHVPPDGFKSGRRQYTCRAFLLDFSSTTTSGQPKFLVILERVSRTGQIDVARWSERYHLTTRERETVEHLLEGLGSREIANKMGISPSTVKSFLRLVMVKVGAANRAEIVAKLHGELSGVDSSVAS